MPSAPNVAALHLRADENGTCAVGVGSTSPGAAAGRPACTARMVELGADSAAMTARRAAADRASSAPGPGTRRSRARSPSVRVPVLSRQMVSTRASVSMAGSSCTSTCRRPRRTTPTAKATLVSSTSPSGTIATTPATVPRIDSAIPSLACSWLTSRRMPVGTMR